MVNESEKEKEWGPEDSNAEPDPHRHSHKHHHHGGRDFSLGEDDAEFNYENTEYEEFAGEFEDWNDAEEFGYNKRFPYSE